MKYLKTITNGLLDENPTFRLVLGMCPTLAISTSIINGIGMGLSTLFVLAFSNLLISLLRKFIPEQIRLPAYIVVIATFVTIVELTLKAYMPDLSKALGVYVSLIVVNCIVMGRAEAYASKNPPLSALCDGIGMGLGFTCALTLLSAVRELLGNGSLLGIQLFPDKIGFFLAPPGGFICLALMMALFNVIIGKMHKKEAKA